MFYITDHFTLEEMIRSQIAERYVIDNTPRAIESVNLTYNCLNMERIRSACDDNFVQVTSGFRSPRLNKKIGGAEKSDHVWGRATDFVIPHFGSVNEIIRRIVDAGIPFEKLIDEFGRWVHISHWPYNDGGEGVLLKARKVKRGGKWKTVYSRHEL